MIRKQWYVVLESKQVKKKPIGVTRLGEKLVFFAGRGWECQLRGRLLPPSEDFIKPWTASR